MLAGTEESFAALRRHASRYLSLPEFSLWAASIQDDSLPARTLRPTPSVSAINCDTQVDVRSCALGNDLVRDSDALFAKVVVDVPTGWF